MPVVVVVVPVVVVVVMVVVVGERSQTEGRVAPVMPFLPVTVDWPLYVPSNATSYWST